LTTNVILALVVVALVEGRLEIIARIEANARRRQIETANPRVVGWFVVDTLLRFARNDGNGGVLSFGA